MRSRREQVAIDSDLVIAMACMISAESDVVVGGYLRRQETTRGRGHVSQVEYELRLGRAVRVEFVSARSSTSRSVPRLSNPTRSNPARSNPTRSNLPHLNASNSIPTQSNPSGFNLPHPNASHSIQSGPNPPLPRRTARRRELVVIPSLAALFYAAYLALKESLVRAMRSDGDVGFGDGYVLREPVVVIPSAASLVYSAYSDLRERYFGGNAPAACQCGLRPPRPTRSCGGR